MLTGAESPARVFSEIVGAKIVPAANTRDARSRIPLAPAYQHVMFVTAGSAEVEGTALGRGSLLYLSAGREQVPVAAGGWHSAAAAGRRPARRTPADVVELRRAHHGRDHGGA